MQISVVDNLMDRFPIILNTIARTRQAANYQIITNRGARGIASLLGAKLLRGKRVAQQRRFSRPEGVISFDASRHAHLTWRAGVGVTPESNGAWRSLVAHLLWEQRVGGSNPSAPTISRSNKLGYSGRNLLGFFTSACSSTG